jgi:hypothetical protein
MKELRKPGQEVLEAQRPKSKMTRTVEYTNRKGKTYYLHAGKTKKDNLRYYFSTEISGELIQDIPKGYEIYENPNALVYLRKSQAREIFDEEMEIVQQELNACTEPSKYKIDVKGKVLTIFWADQSDFGMIMLAALGGISKAQEFRVFV